MFLRKQQQWTWWPARNLTWLLWYVCARNQVYARSKSHFLVLCTCVVFYSVRFAFFSKVCVHLKHVQLLASILLRLCVIGLVGVAPFCTRSPPR